MDRQFELQKALPPKDWERYSKGLPVYSRDGEYLGRDMADTSSLWKMNLTVIPLVLLAVLIDSRLAEKIYERLESNLVRTSKIINPEK